MDLNEADIIERYGWTYNELDNSDEDRVFGGVVLQNIRDSVDRIKSWLRAMGKMSISKHDLRIYGMVMEAEKELNGGIAVMPPAEVSGIEEFNKAVNPQ